MKKIQLLIPIFFFILLLCAGIILHNDYGGFTDELLHIQTAAINYKFVLSKVIPVEKIPPVPIFDLNKLPDLNKYINQYYGEAVMMPTLLISLIPRISFTTAEFLNFRRFYTFLNFFIALICFYSLLRIRFSNQMIAFIGTIMLTLSPRFFAESFYNSKDIIFFCWFLISIFGIGFFIIKNSRWGLLIFSVAFGLTVNTRIYGIILLPAFLCLMLIDNAKNHHNSSKRLWQILITAICALLLYFILTPYLWENPFQGFLAGLRFSSQEVGISQTDLLNKNNQVSLGNQELFMGRFVPPGQTWLYIPVWMGITIPLLYIILFFFELFFFLKQTFRNKLFQFLNNTYLFDSFCIILFFGCLTGIIISKVTIYHGWRHIYFLYAPFIYLAACGFGNIWNISFQKKIIQRIKNVFFLGIISVSFATTGLWIVKNHPLDFVYFNEIGRHYAQQFTRDYWGVASKSCIQDLAGEYDGIHPMLLGVNADLTYGSAENSLLRFPTEIQERFQVVWKNDNAEYLCFSYKNIPGNDHQIPGFEIMKTYRVDGYDVAAIYKRINNN